MQSTLRLSFRSCIFTWYHLVKLLLICSSKARRKEWEAKNQAHLDPVFRTLATDDTWLESEIQKRENLLHRQRILNLILKSNDWSTALLFVLGCSFVEYIYIYIYIFFFLFSCFCYLSWDFSPCILLATGILFFNVILLYICIVQ